MSETTEDAGIWGAFEPIASLLTDKKSEEEAKIAAAKLEAERNAYENKIKELQQEVLDVNQEATKARQEMWEVHDRLKDAQREIVKLEDHLKELLELREKDLENLRSLRLANAECVENESRAREAMEVFKKCYKRSQVKIKENEQEIVNLRTEQGALAVVKSKTEDGEEEAMVNESALEYIQAVSNEKEKRLKKMLSETEVEVDLWKSKYKIANKRCMNWQEQILAMEHPTEGAVHIQKQRIQIEELQAMVEAFQNKEAELKAQEDCRNPLDGLVCAGPEETTDARDGAESKGFLSFIWA